MVTGAGGFAGRPTCEALAAAGWRVRGAFRSGSGGEGPWHEGVEVGEIGPGTRWEEALAGVTAVIHLAARVHQMEDKEADPLAAFRRVNTEGTRCLAEAAVKAGVERVVLVSSIKVNGEATGEGEAWTEADEAAPQDAYGRSKAEAEEALWAVTRGTGLEGVVVRPPLMVGKGVKGNLQALAGVIRRGWPLPLGGITENRRSLLDVRNLAEVLTRCGSHPGAAGETFLVSDGVPVSTAELAKRIGDAVGRRARLVPVPLGVLRWAGRLTGKGAAVERLTGSLLIDAAKVRAKLGWTPRFGPGDWEV